MYRRLNENSRPIASFFLKYHSYVFVGLAIWLASRPYQGLVHDSRLYAVQALNAITGLYKDDLYFKFGSQDGFTLFTPVYSLFIDVFGLPAASLVLLVIGQALWLAGLVRFAGRFAKTADELFFAVALAMALPSTYGGLRIFQFGEAFLTPRLFAEGLAMLALAELGRGRAWRIVLPLIAGGILHPLMTAPAVAVVVLWQAVTTRSPVWWGVMGAGLVVPLGLAWAGIEPFGRLLATYDPEWFAVVHHRTAFAFLGQWEGVDWAILATTLSLAGAGAVTADRNARLYLGCIAAVAFGGLAATLIGADWAHNVFAVNVQQWRALWLLGLCANIQLAMLLFRLPRGGGIVSARRLAWIGLGVLLLTRWFLALHFAAALLFPLLVLLVGREAGLGHKRSLSFAGRVAVYAVLAPVIAATIWGIIIPLRKFWGMPPLTRTLLEAALVCTTVIAAGLLAWGGPTSRRIVATGAVLVAGVAALSWDRRDGWAHYLDSAGVPPGLEDVLARGRVVYWDDGLELLWLKARRSSYYSCVQGTGAMFFRATALEYDRRVRTVTPLSPSDFKPDGICPRQSKEAGAADSLPAEVVRRACAEARELDYVVLARPVGGLPAYRIWQTPAPREHLADDGQHVQFSYISKYFIYRCADFGERLAGTH